MHNGDNLHPYNNAVHLDSGLPGPSLWQSFVFANCFAKDLFSQAYRSRWWALFLPALLLIKGSTATRDRFPLFGIGNSILVQAYVVTFADGTL